MKYRIEPLEVEPEFKPFRIILTIETYEEYENFHDNAMGRITQTGSHQFHGDVYNSSHNPRVREGEI